MWIRMPYSPTSAITVEIASNFLTPDQLEILERYFGYTPNYRDVERFWKNLVSSQR